MYPGARAGTVRRALRLEYFTVTWNALEAIVGIAAGLASGSVALIGFALDSVVETSSAVVLIWRLRSDDSEEAERKAVRGVAIAFGALAIYVAAQAGLDLATASRPGASIPGMVLAAVSLVVMPVLARWKRAAAHALDSRSMRADSTQTILCAWLSGVLLVGLTANAFLGWWWADPVAALAIAAFAGREAVGLWRTEDFCC